MVRSLRKKGTMIDTGFHVDTRLNSTSTTWSVTASADSSYDAIYTHDTFARTRMYANRCGLTSIRRALELVRFTQVSKCTGKVSVVFPESMKFIWSTSTEYAYGGHPYTFTGVFAMTPKRDSELMNQGVKFRESISMGFTSLTEEGVREVVSAMEKEYIGQYYDMLHKYVFGI